MKFGLSLAVKSPTPWGQPLAQVYRDVLGDVELAEELGFDSVMITEHHFTEDGWCPAPLVLAGAIAARTSRVRIGTAILILPFYNPVRLAEDVAVLDVISGGRAVLGVGMGYRSQEFDGLGLAMSERLPRFLEGLEILRRCWTEDEVEYEGAFFKIRGARVRPRPVQAGGPPIWVGANTKAGIRRAAELGLTYYFGNAAPLGVLSERVAYFDDALRAVGRNPQTVEKPVMRELYVAPSSDQAWSEASEGIVYSYREELIGLGFGVVTQDDQGRPEVVTTRDHPIFEPHRLAADRMVIGSPDDCIEEIGRYQRLLGATEILFRVHHPGMPTSKVRACLELFAREVLPAFRPASSVPPHGAY
jgi:probable F420-dependent oxidoreductase